MTYTFWKSTLGWLVTLLSLIVYFICLEPSVSLWDCGEFLSAANKLQVVHPPGAPLFLLLGRLAAALAPGAEYVAVFVNGLSAICSAFTVYFTYHIIVLLAERAQVLSGSQAQWPKVLNLAGASIGALALAFSDTFWFSAVETEVYALSSFFTAITFWAALKWFFNHETYADKWLILIAYLIGLAIGAHLLSLLVIPSISFLFFYKKKQSGLKNNMYAFLIGLMVLFFIQNGLIPGIPKLLAALELFMVNDLGFGFDSGMILALVLIMAVLTCSLYYFSRIKYKPSVHLALLCLSYLILGFSSYTMVIVRSRDALPIDMNNPDDPFNLKFYINREQYEERPLLKGPYFNAPAIDVKEGAAEYRKDQSAYTFTGHKQSYVFDPDYNVVFPRMSDMQKSSSPMGYRIWGGMSELEDELQYLEQNLSQLKGRDYEQARARIEEIKAEKPKMSNNITYFLDYQINHMYLRYFMWNFSGRQNDRQGHAHNRNLEGNWISGIPLIDGMRLGPQKNLPKEMAENKGRNVYFMLPLLLGIAGVFFQYKRDRNMLQVTGVLFLFTGLLIIVFLNQPPFEPRERDYVHVGSFQVFCLWIGLGSIQIYLWMNRKFKALMSVVLTLMIALFIPLCMLQQGWDDHNRSGRFIALDLAKNILDSCPQNALFLGNADNDTYPVWYMQNVLGYRTDVRVVNQNLLPTDWCSSQLLTQVYASKPFKMLFESNDLRKGVNEYFQWRKSESSDTKMELNQFLQDLKSKGTGYFSNNQLYVTIDTAQVLKHKSVHGFDRNIADTMQISLPASGIHKGDLVLLALVAESAKSGFKRPICFSTIAGDDGYKPYARYLQKRGMVYELCPVYTEQSARNIKAINADVSYDLLMNTFSYGGIKRNSKFYVDDKSQIFHESLRQLFMETASYYLSEKMNGEQSGVQGNHIHELESKVKALLNKCQKELPVSICPLSEVEAINLANIYRYLNDSASSRIYLEMASEQAMQKLVYYKQFLQTSNSSDYIISLIQDAIQMVEQCHNYNEQWKLNSTKLNQKQSFDQMRREIQSLI